MQLNIQQADDLWQVIKDESDKVRKSNLTLELTRLLLEYMDLSDQDVQGLEETDDLTDLFIEYRKIANLCNAFFDQSLAHLDPEIQGTNFEKKIAQAQTRIKEVVDKTQKLKETHEELLTREDDLKNKQQELQDLDSKLEELKSLEEEIKPERLDVLKKEVSALQEQVKIQRPEVESLKAQKQELNTRLQQISALKEKISLENQEVRQSFLELCQNLSESIDEKWQGVDEQLNTNLSKLKQRMRCFQDIVSRLENSLKELEEVTEVEENNLELYIKHIEANGWAAEAIKADKVNMAQASQNEFSGKIKEISKLSREIQKNLTTYDQRLKEAITAREEFRQKIRRLNKPGQRV
jgi:chromosome segregation ATPase